MTTLKEMLEADRTFYYKEGNKPAVTVLRSVLGEITVKEKSGKSGTELSDAEVESVIAREAKKRRASAEEYSSLDSEEATDRAAVETWEAEFLAQYLPKQLSEDEVRDIVQAVIVENEGANMGLVMKNAMAKLKGKADGKLVKQIVSSELAS